MKLRNKKTGEIVSLSLYGIQVYSRTEEQPIYHSLAELNEEWEDYKEPKEFWFIDDEGCVEVESEEYEEHLDEMKAIGNYFETKEEAEKAVEMLKAIKKLKEYDLYIEWANTPVYDEDEDRWYCSVDFSVREGCNGDLLFNLLFGGEK